MDGSLQGCDNVEAGVANIEVYIQEAKSGGKCRGRGDGVFTQAAQIVRPNADHVATGLQQQRSLLSRAGGMGKYDKLHLGYVRKNNDKNRSILIRMKIEYKKQEKRDNHEIKQLA